jgi:hypothetical protein
MQAALVFMAFVIALAYLVRGLYRGLAGNCGGCGGAKRPVPALIPVEDLTVRARRRERP